LETGGTETWRHEASKLGKDARKQGQGDNEAGSGGLKNRQETRKGGKKLETEGKKKGT
jgi:hypothetical protein